MLSPLLSNHYKFNVEGTVRISGLSFYHNVNNPQYIWNSGNLSFRHGSPGSSNVILKLRSTKLESALEHHFDINSSKWRHNR